MKKLNLTSISSENDISCVYEILNKKNNKKYIGVTTNFKSRILAHYVDIVKGKHLSIIPTQYEVEGFLDNLQYKVIVNVEELKDKGLIKVIESFCMMKENINVYNSNVNANISRIHKPLLYTLLLKYENVDEVYKDLLNLHKLNKS